MTSQGRLIEHAPPSSAVTPPEVVNALLNGHDPTAPAGQTYAQQLALGLVGVGLAAVAGPSLSYQPLFSTQLKVEA